MRKGERDAIKARLALFGERMAAEGTLSAVTITGREVSFVYRNGETEVVDLEAAPAFADALADDVWRACDPASDRVLDGVREWVAKLEYQPKADYALELAQCAVSGAELSRNWLELDRPWQWKVRERLVRLGVPRGAIERAAGMVPV